MGVGGRVGPEGKLRRRESVGDTSGGCGEGDDGRAVFVSLPSELCFSEGG